MAADYVTPMVTDIEGETLFSFSGVEKAAFWKDGAWIHAIEAATAPIAELDSGELVYTAPPKRISLKLIPKFLLMN